VTDPKRLVDEGGLGATLLAAACSDTPGRSARDRAAVAVGLAVSIAAATSASSTAGAGVVGAVGSGGGAVAKSASAAAWIKLAAGVLIAAALAGGAMVAADRHKAPRPAAVSAPPPVATTTVHASEMARPSSDETPFHETPLATTPRRTPAQGGADPGRTKAAIYQSAEAPLESPLARELRSLDDARSALDRHEIADALADLDRYERTFPTGTLRTEASLLRVESLLARGDGPDARRLARELLAQDPSGPHARRLRTIVENP
jgi:hypothetical protein